jgi:hypothetical protein
MERGLLVSDGAWPFGVTVMVAVNCRAMMLVLVRGLYMVGNPGVINAKTLFCKT